MLRIAIALSAAALCLAPAMASAKEKIVDVAGTLDYAAPDEDAADRFFSKLDSTAGSGSVVRLDLKIVPRAEEDHPGFEIVRKRDGAAVCRGKAGGSSTTLDDAYVLTFNHTVNYHAPTTIEIADRRRSPSRTLVCGKAGRDGIPSSVRLRGLFEVSAEDIPTARQFDLSSVRR